jgi:hypothetical protein
LRQNRIWKRCLSWQRKRQPSHLKAKLRCIVSMQKLFERTSEKELTIR